jgi:serine/threonine-protein kinase RsbW
MKSSGKHTKPVAGGNTCIYEMVCRSQQKEISHIEKFLHHISVQQNIDDGTLHRLLVSCTEAVNNAILHGNKSDPHKEVLIRCIVRKKTLTLYVRDEGLGFDPESLQDPRDEKNLLKESGRGVFLIRSLMDKVKFKKLKSGSVVEMQVRLH